MVTTSGLAYLVWIASVVGLAALLRSWYAGKPGRSQLVFWILLTLLFPPFSLLVFILAKFMRIRVAAIGVR